MSATSADLLHSSARLALERFGKQATLEMLTTLRSLAEPPSTIRCLAASAGSTELVLYAENLVGYLPNDAEIMVAGQAVEVQRGGDASEGELSVVVLPLEADVAPGAECDVGSGVSAQVVALRDTETSVFEVVAEGATGAWYLCGSPGDVPRVGDRLVVNGEPARAIVSTSGLGFGPESGLWRVEVSG